MRSSPRLAVLITVLAILFTSPRASAQPHRRSPAHLPNLHFPRLLAHHSDDAVSSPPSDTSADDFQDDPPMTRTTAPAPPSPTFAPQPQLITLAPPLASIHPPAAPGIILPARRDPNASGLGHWADYSPATEAEEADDDEDDHSNDAPPSDGQAMVPSPGHPRGSHYRPGVSFWTGQARKLRNKGKKRRLLANGVIYNGEGGRGRRGGDEKKLLEQDTEADWMAWRSQFALQQQWRRCERLGLGSCPSQSDGREGGVGDGAGHDGNGDRERDRDRVGATAELLTD